MSSVFSEEQYTLKYSSAVFNLLHGAVIKDLSCVDPQGAVLFETRRLDFGFHAPPILKGQILIKQIKVGESRVYPERISGQMDGLRKVISRLDRNVGLFSTSYLILDHMWLGEDIAIQVHGYVSALKGGLFVSRGEVRLKNIPALENLDAEALGEGSLGEPFDYLLDIEAGEDSFAIVRFEMSNPVLRFFGSGRLEGLSRPEPAINFQLEAPHLILDEMPVLNNENVQTRGLAVLSLNWSGSLSRPVTKAELEILNVDVGLFDSVSISKINGNFTYSGEEATSSAITFQVNQRPFEASLKVGRSGEGDPSITSEIKSVPVAGQDVVFGLNISAVWSKAGRLKGNIDGDWQYSTKALFHHLVMNFQGFEAGIDEDLFITTRDAGLVLEVFSLEDRDKPKEVFRRSFSLDNLFAVVRRQENGFSLEPLKAGCCEGAVEGWLSVISAEGVLTTKAEAHMRGVNLRSFAERSPGETSLILGRLDGDLKLDTTEPKDPLKGQIFVENGRIEQNSLLNAVSDFLGVPSLRRIGFDRLSIFFNGGHAEYFSKVDLQAKEVSAQLEGRIFNYETMDGYLSAVISTRLLNESRQFKKILRYIKHDEPSVVFPFKISSYLESPRVLWLKNVFKDKLLNLLPERNKRFLQKQVNVMIEGM